ncbi:hypothetical protein ALI144C_40675 [Actinosynnema sp. ALI-1.44]|uniref:permease-like cell division protein FtsX n=1 Tax=Actinosynnema sp. ALI-1.44 TaxID=1933779 RepID=UPI00097C63B5|nr:permease-like cell division protein FtsX [Actinosynnema sp. ALI-1.44]ONI75078.1 hypothetical protein ALI144C_40675 [Actinosynnema sp. ALI-1.44]
MTEPAFSEPPSPPPPPAPKRQPWLLYVIVLVAVAGAGVAVGALIWGGDSRNQATEPTPEEVRVQAARDLCVRSVNMYFNDRSGADEKMRQAADHLRGDPRFEKVEALTKRENYEKFKRIYANQPELLDLTRPESLPATVNLVVRDGSTGEEVAGALRRKFAQAEVQTLQPYCDNPPGDNPPGSLRPIPTS